MSLVSRIVNYLRRPLPDLLGFTLDKVRSRLWRRHVGRCGSRFHVGQGSIIEGGSYIELGEHFYAGAMLWLAAVSRYREFEFTPVVRIGRDFSCSQRVHIAATTSIVIGDSVMFGSGVHVTDHGHGTYSGPVQDGPEVPPALRKPSTGRPVYIGSNVWLGDNVVVLAGVTIGDGVIVGANSVVSRSLPAHVMAVGSPAKPIKLYDTDSGQWLPVN